MHKAVQLFICKWFVGSQDLILIHKFPIFMVVQRGSATVLYATRLYLNNPWWLFFYYLTETINHNSCSVHTRKLKIKHLYQHNKHSREAKLSAHIMLFDTKQSNQTKHKARTTLKFGFVLCKPIQPNKAISLNHITFKFSLFYATKAFLKTTQL